ncbi:glycosyl hydrolases family 31-domain-containing protein [Echria macrotheca]|uniref:alpha-glucosidase n=1 Tax=Echria macrotheca TaxID=438768 RepID=A0AAJ0F3B1_9PEZI|nr:glycosyl hydrolases family 31-domain-containing protein [Echria macrotheca]
MSITERDLTNLILHPSLESLTPGATLRSFTLISGPSTPFPDFTWTLEFPLPQAYRILLTGPDRPRPAHDNIRAPPSSSFCTFSVLAIDTSARTATFAFPAPTPTSLSLSGITSSSSLQLRLWWSHQIATEVWECISVSGKWTPLLRDLRARSYGLTEHGTIRHWTLDRTSRIHLGLGEKAAPLDLTGRRFAMHATDAAWYDAYRTDPLYKHTPFLISTPKPRPDSFSKLTYALVHATNSVATWDVGAEIDFPSGGWSKRFVQDWGGLEEWVLLGQGVEGCVRTYGELAGRPGLVGREWLGSLGSSMLLSDKENGQELMEEWPGLCRRYDVPCSAMHLSSGYTIDDATGARWVFKINKRRFPDLKGMVAVFHRAGMKIIPNVKPYLLVAHPDYDRLRQGDGLFYDPISNGPSRQNMWTGGFGESGDGSWADFTAPETRRWWAEGVRGLLELGFDGIWDDNNEFFLRDDALLCKNQLDDPDPNNTNNNAKEKLPLGLLGRIRHAELMNKTSLTTFRQTHPTRRPFILTRSGNPSTFRHANATWTGDNHTSWPSLRGSQHIQLNSSLSLLPNTGSDVGGFGGDAPSPELLVRWVQLGVTHARFCIHSCSPDTRGRDKLTAPWMYPSVLGIIRAHIKWRYFVLPFLNHLMWRAHLYAEPITAPLFYGPFASDAVLYDTEKLEGFDAWLGVGQLLVCPQLFQGRMSREGDVYFPRAARGDESLYFDLNPPFMTYKAGTWAPSVATPLEHGGLFAREGAVIPVGKDKATVTALEGLARTHPDGVRTVLDYEEDGEGCKGLVGLDDWRGVMLFPGFGNPGKEYKGEWIEDDGVSEDPGTFTVVVSYRAVDEGTVEVQVGSQDGGFMPLWTPKLYVLLPVGDARSVRGADQTVWRDRAAWIVHL